METETITVSKKMFKDTCSICGKDIIGSTENQVNFNMNVHKMTKHPSENAK